MNYFDKRLKQVQNLISDDQAIFINKQEEVFYFTGFTGEDAYLFITRNQVYFITDSRFTEQAEQETRIKFNIEEIKPDYKLIHILKSIIKDHKIKYILCYKKEIDADFYENLIESLNSNNKESNERITIQNSDVVKDLRICKDEFEIEIMRQNIIMTELGYHYIIRLIEEGKKEIDIAAELEYYIRKNGALRPSFDTIIASGQKKHSTAWKSKRKDYSTKRSHHPGFWHTKKRILLRLYKIVLFW